MLWIMRFVLSANAEPALAEQARQMGWEGWATLAVLGLIIGMLSMTRSPAYIILLGGLTILLTLGIVDHNLALSGASNPGVITVGVLFAVVTGLRETGAMAWLTQSVLGRPGSVRSAQTRVMLPVGLLSAFMNNTPIVAAMLPAIHDWAKQTRISVSRLLMPLSFASILGGNCTLIGTSTILVINGLLISELGEEHGLGMFDLTLVGLPCALAGIGFILLAERWLLPDRQPPISFEDDARHYTTEMVVEPNSPLEGKTIEEAGLRQLPGLFLTEIERDGQVLPAVSPHVRLRGNDRLVFAGVVESVVDLQNIRGLRAATNQVYKLDEPRTNRALVEAVVSDTCPLVGQTIREGRFRTRYNAAVLAVARNGERLRKKIGDIRLQPGDTLLLEARSSFADQQRNSRDFYLVSRIENSTPVRHERAWIALLVLGAMVATVTAGWLSMLNAAMIAAGLMIATRCCTASAALRNVDWQVLMVIAAAFGIGRAMEASGAAQTVAAWMLIIAEGPWLSLAVICGVTMLFTNLLSSNAAAVLMFPIAMATAENLDVSIMPFAVATMLGAASSFATPLGYQTNLMVQGPGGYRFNDFVRFGLPLSVLIWGMLVTLIPWFWPFAPAGG
jgi:di/tricarboxylate transporter